MTIVYRIVGSQSAVGRTVESDVKYGGLKFNFFLQAEDGIRDAQESRGLGDVYKRQIISTER